MTFPYRIVTEWSEEDACYVARVPALGYVAAHGASADEATREVIAAGELAIESMRAHGDPIPAPDVASPPRAAFG